MRALWIATAICFAMGLGTAAQAANGHWKFSGYTTKPPQSQLDATAAAQDPSRVYEARVNGAFQPAESGAGTLNLYFKNDDIDRKVYLTTLTFSFTTGVEMRTLSAGQELHFHGVLTMGGNGASKAIPADGSGNIAADVGDWFLTTNGAIDRNASASGVLKIPTGGPGATMRIYAEAHLGSYGALTGDLDMNYVWVEGAATGQAPDTSPAPSHDALGTRLDVDELDGLWKGVWVRRPGTNIFDAEWHSAQYPEVRDVVRIESISGGRVVLTRDGNSGRYYGTLSPDGGNISGTASWYSGNMRWRARISGR